MQTKMGGLDLNLLVVFAAVMDEKNVTRASQRLGKSQPATSNALNRLRLLIGDPLFVPGPRGNVGFSYLDETTARRHLIHYRVR